MQQSVYLSVKIIKNPLLCLFTNPRLAKWFCPNTEHQVVFPAATTLTRGHCVAAEQMKILAAWAGSLGQEAEHPRSLIYSLGTTLETKPGTIKELTAFEIKSKAYFSDFAVFQ